LSVAAQHSKRRQAPLVAPSEVHVSQFRKDILSDRWVIVAEANALRPTDFQFNKFSRDAKFCPFCETNEASTPPEVFAIRSPGSLANRPGWLVRVVPNSQPRLRIEGGLERRSEGLHDLMNGIGAHEIIVETPRHDRSLHELEIPEISNVLQAYAARISDLQQDLRMRYILIFKNHGEEAGAHTVSHSISRLMGLPSTPMAIKNKLIVARRYYAEKERCIFCDVIRQELKDQRLIAENKDFVSFAPYASRIPFEMAVYPKFHSSAFSKINPTQNVNLTRILRDVLQKLDQTLGSPPYNLSLQDRPRLYQREGYWETIEQDFHWHIEILPRISRLTGFEWASGMFYNPVPPEMAAQCLSCRT
jgi:UDPglucose--hexose-1-phosphate uridylyltransferase